MGYRTAFIFILGAVLNFGWKSASKKWLRKGDFCYDSSHRIKAIPEDGGVVELDIKVKQYTHGEFKIIIYFYNKLKPKSKNKHCFYIQCAVF